MNKLKKTAAGTLFGGALLISGFGGGTSLAHAAPPPPEAQAAGDGQVDVAVSTNAGQIGTIPNIKVANALNLVNSVCPVSGITEANLNDLDANGTTITQSCAAVGGLSFSFTQNGAGEAQTGYPGRAELPPVQNKNTDEGQPPGATPTTAPGQVGR